MKSFLQKVGVLTKDGQEAAPAPAPAPVPEPRTVKLDGAATPADVITVNAEDVEIAQETFRIAIRGEKVLEPLFKVLDQADKLVRIPDDKTRLLTALDIAGVEASEVLDAAELYPTIAGQLYGESVTKFEDKLKPKFEEVSQARKKLEEERADLEARLMSVDTSIQAAVEELNLLDRSAELHENIMLQATTNLLNSFNDVAVKLKTNLA